jgi:hypothetical protein
VKTGGCDPRDLQLSGSLGAEGVLKYYMYTIVKISHSASLRLLFQGLILLEYSHVYGWDMYTRDCFAATRVRADLSWRRASELTADNREATLRHGVRLQLTSHVRLESPLVGRREATHAGGGSEIEERHCVAGEVHMIARRRRSPVRRGFEEIFPYPTSFAERRFDPRVRPTPPVVVTFPSRQCA